MLTLQQKKVLERIAQDTFQGYEQYNLEKLTPDEKSALSKYSHKLTITPIEVGFLQKAIQKITPKMLQMDRARDDIWVLIRIIDALLKDSQFTHLILDEQQEKMLENFK
jgi:hypothetical protein